MAFAFEKSSCVVVGTFNMYILHPEWLTRHEIVDHNLDLLVESNFTQPGIRYRFPQNNSIWQISPTRVSVESSDPNLNCGSFIHKVLRALPETPLVALGSNIQFKAEPSELSNLADEIKNFPVRNTIAEGECLEQRTFHYAVKRGEQRLQNLQLSLSADFIELMCNSHTKLEGNKEANEIAQQAALGFIADCEYAKTLSHHLFGTNF